MRRVKKIVGWICFGLLALLFIGVLYEQLCQLYFNTKEPAADEFCEVDGYRVHFKKKGSGGPTVVFQSGLGGDYKIWKEIQDTLAQYTTTISYDRAGLLWSEARNETKTLENITSELKCLLEQTNSPKPYILVGHSLAGITLRPFIRDHSQDIAGIVFVDVAHPLQIKKSSEELKKYLVIPPRWLVTFLIETGMIRTYFALKPFVSDLPVNHWMNQHVRDYFYRMYKTFLQEAVDDDPMFEQSESISSFGDIPLSVITGAYPNGVDFLRASPLAAEFMRLHRQNQEDLLNLSTHSKQIIASKSGHYVPLTDPEIVSQAILQQLER